MRYPAVHKFGLHDWVWDHLFSDDGIKYGDLLRACEGDVKKAYEILTFICEEAFMGENQEIQNYGALNGIELFQGSYDQIHESITHDGRPFVWDGAFEIVNGHLAFSGLMGIGLTNDPVSVYVRKNDFLKPF